MTETRPVKIAGLATYVPPRLLTNADLEKMVDTTDEWIRKRTGIDQQNILMLLDQRHMRVAEHNDRCIDVSSAARDPVELGPPDAGPIGLLLNRVRIVTVPEKDPQAANREQLLIGQRLLSM